MTTIGDSLKSQSYDDDREIDFHKLERELENAVAADAKYMRENDAKFRAVYQKVATYDEFRDIVLASHLKPLEQTDRLTNVKFTQPWNSLAKKHNIDSSNRPDGHHLPKGQFHPSTSQSFLREWRQLKGCADKQYNYLLEIGGEKLGVIFKPEIGFGLLGEFVKCLENKFQDADFAQVLNILRHLSGTYRFTLTVQFLSAKEKEVLLGLFEKLQIVAQNTEEYDWKSALIDLMELYEMKK